MLVLWSSHIHTAFRQCCSILCYHNAVTNYLNVLVWSALMLGTNTHTTFTQPCLNIVWMLWYNVFFNTVRMLWQHHKIRPLIFSNVMAMLQQRCDITFFFNVVATLQQRCIRPNQPYKSGHYNFFPLEIISLNPLFMRFSPVGSSFR